MLLTLISLICAAAAALICNFTVGFSSLAWLWAAPLSFVGCYILCLGGVFLFLWLLSRSIDTSVPQQEDSRFMRWVARMVCPAVFPLLHCRVRTKGLEKLPKDGRFVLVCNPLGILDPILLMAKFPDAQLAFISKQENEDMFIIGRLMHRIMTQKINRDNDREALRTIINCVKLVQADKVSIAVFPEGYTSRDHHLHKFRNGVFKIAQRAKVPIVVCTITGTQAAFHNAGKGKRTDVTLHLVEVIPAGELEGVTTTVIGDRVHDIMTRDLVPYYGPAEEE